MKAVQMLMTARREKPRVYGYLYNWYALGNIASTGWRASTRSDYVNLCSATGNYVSQGNYFMDSGGSLKSTRTSPLPHPRWSYPNTGATNIVNMSMYSGGSRTEGTGQFGTIGTTGRYWADTSISESNANVLTISSSDSIATVGGNSSASNTNKKYGYSARVCRELISGEELLTDGTYVADYVGNDLKTYKAVKIGSLVWTAENLAETLYNDLSPIPNVTDNTEWRLLTTGARCAYNNNEDYV